MTSMRIEKTSEGKNYIFFRASCSCGNDRDSHVIEISNELANIGVIEMSFYSTQWDCIYFNNPGSDEEILRNFWWRLKRRIVNSFKLLFFGYYETEVNFMFNGEEQIQDYINALQDGLDKVKKFGEERSKNIKKPEPPSGRVIKEGNSV